MPDCRRASISTSTSHASSNSLYAPEVSGPSVTTIAVVIRLDSAQSVLDHLPVNAVPPRRQICTFPQHTVVRDPLVFPDIDTQNGLGVQQASESVRLVGTKLAKGTSSLSPAGDDSRSTSNSTLEIVCKLSAIEIRHVPCISPRSRFGIRTAGVVCGQDCHSAGGGWLHQPDEAVSKHGVGCLEEFGAQVVHRFKVHLNISHRLHAWTPLRRIFTVCQGFPKEMCVICHCCMVVESCPFRSVGALKVEVSGLDRFVGCACKRYVRGSYSCLVPTLDVTSLRNCAPWVYSVNLSHRYCEYLA